jgi:hypothetical protein
VSVEAIGEGDYYSPTVEETHCYFDAAGRLHSNSGKDLMISSMLTYAAWAIVQMRNPWFHFKMAAGDTMDILNVAQDRQSAQKNFFDRVKENLRRPCFAHLIDQERDILATSVEFKKAVTGHAFPVTALTLRSLTSKVEGVEGANTLMFAMDEADAFRTNSGHDKGRAMLSSLRTSSRGTQIGAIFSWPRSETGLMFEELQKCGNLGGPNYEHWGVKAPTGEVLDIKCWVPDGVDEGGKPLEGTVWRNPITGYDSTQPGAIVDEVMWDVYRTDPALFAAMYMCRPKPTEDGWIQMPHIVDDAVVLTNEPAARANPYVSSRADEGKVTERIALLLEGLELRPRVQYGIGIDCGLDDDSMALSLHHAVPANERGAISPEAWAVREERLSKHYRALPIPVDAEGRPLLGEDGAPLYPELISWRPEDWRCDWTGRVPRPGEDKFWGVCVPSGKQLRTPVIEKYERGAPVYAVDKDGKPLMETLYYPHLVEDLLLEWRPDQQAQRPVDLMNVEAVIIQLAEAIKGAKSRLLKIRADQWQMELMLQRLNARGIRVEAVQMSNTEQARIYDSYRMLLQEGLVDRLPCLEPLANGEPCKRCTHCRATRQFKELIRKNGKIDHPDYSLGGGKGRKDLTDAIALACDICLQARKHVGRLNLGETVLPGRIGNPGSLSPAQQLAAKGRGKLAGKRSVVDTVLGEFGVKRR